MALNPHELDYGEAGGLIGPGQSPDLLQSQFLAELAQRAMAARAAAGAAGSELERAQSTPERNLYRESPVAVAGLQAGARIAEGLGRADAPATLAGTLAERQSTLRTQRAETLANLSAKYDELAKRASSLDDKEREAKFLALRERADREHQRQLEQMRQEGQTTRALTPRPPQQYQTTRTTTVSGLPGGAGGTKGGTGGSTAPKSRFSTANSYFVRTDKLLKLANEARDENVRSSYISALNEHLVTPYKDESPEDFIARLMEQPRYVYGEAGRGFFGLGASRAVMESAPVDEATIRALVTKHYGIK